MSFASTFGCHASLVRTSILASTLAVSLTGCLFDGDLVPDRSGNATTGSTSIDAPSNRAPTITGAPLATARVNEAYSFQPSASDPDGDALTFQISNKPAWATFDTRTGRLSGTPSTSSTGVFSDVRITVSDGRASSALAPFAISVTSSQTTGSATLSWQPPTSNTDGSPLTNLAGYVVRYGTAPDALDIEVRINNPGLVTYVVSDLTPATWYFQVVAYNSIGVESSPSATGSKTIS
jgi:Putative Ig domain